MPLTDTAIRNAKPGEKPVKLFDGGGLYSWKSPRRREVVATEVPVRRQGKAAVPWRLSRRELERRPRPPGRIAQAAGRWNRPQRKP